VLVASHSSVAALARLGIKAEYAPYPWPETGHVQAPQPAELPTFLFFGQLGGLGSRSALHFMFEKVYPRLRRRWGPEGFRILIAGAGEFPDWAVRLVDGLKEVERMGFVEDLGVVLRRCHAALFPIAVPVGNRSRILTAMAYGVPVIAHRNCALGNSNLVDGETALLAADASGFAERMERIVREPALARSVADRAYSCYKAHFHPEPAGARLAARVQDLLVKRAAVS
jgi:glycosyltransferase involved in cell wall biosynthesis